MLTLRLSPAVHVRILLGCVVVSGLLLANGYQFPSSNHAREIPTILALLDLELYVRDFFVQEMLQFTPRTYYFYGMALLAGTGLGITWTYALTYVMAVVAMLAALYFLAQQVTPSRITALIFVFWVLTVTAGLIGHGTLRPSILASSLHPGVIAMSLSTWGLGFSIRQSWVKAYALFGTACLLQFLVGLLPALLVGPLLLLDVWRRRQWARGLVAAGLLTLGAMLVYLPMVLQGTTSTGLFTNLEFVNIYGYWRHPHHMVPSAWPWATWVHLVLFYAGGTLCILRSRTLSPTLRTGLLTVIGLTSVGLLANYLFVEVWPSALVVKLQFARMTPFAVLAVLLGVAALFYEQWRAGRYALCAMLVVLPVSHLPGLLLGAYAVLLPHLERLTPRLRTPQRWTLIFGLAVLLYRWPIGDPFVYWIKAFLDGPLVLGVLLTPLLIQRWVARRWRTIAAAGLALGIAGVLVIALSGALYTRIDRLVQEQLTIRGVWQDDAAPLARRFAKHSPQEALVLVPLDVQHFRLLSRRAVVVDFKAFPFTERGIAKWIDRMRAVQACDDRPPSCLLAVARRYEAGYILTRREHPFPESVVVDREGIWTLWKITTAHRLPQ
jgi:hypothetical protein